jgi:soluble lytic murein transglycosylase
MIPVRSPWFRKKRVFALLLIVILGLLFYRAQWMLEWLYPIQYKEDILVSAQNYEIDPFLVAAIIRVESNFNKDGLSPKGAVGVMQIMPDTAAWIVEASGFSQDTLLALHRPDVNIEIGTRYLQMLFQQFEGNQAAVLAAYNAGPGNVRKWLQSGTWDGTEEVLEQIPFGETRHYVQRVHYYLHKYRQIYGSRFWAS